MFDVHFQATRVLGDGARRNRLLLPYPPPICFFGSSFLGKIPLSDLDPETIIPLERPGTEGVSGFPFVAYFQAIQQVIEKRGYKNLLSALRIRLGHLVTLDEIREIRIYSEKHGSDYHPARVEVDLRDRSVVFVMNVALTERGRLVLSNEFNVLDELNRRQAPSYLPRAYFWDEAEVVFDQDKKLALPMYLAEWLEGFYEFHLSRDPADGRQKLVLWDSARPDHYLSDRAAEKIYQEIAYILTSYYDLPTFAQIHPWHLAAGDFIVRIEGDRVEVRLVAAREYGPLIGPPDLPWEEAVLFFFLNLSVRIRVDRLDGVGEVVWAEEGCLRSVFEGFYLALKEKMKESKFTEDLPERFRHFFRSLSKDDIEERLAALIEGYNAAAPDLPIIQKHLDCHLEEVFPLLFS
jgi:hypothetical protein